MITNAHRCYIYYIYYIYDIIYNIIVHIVLDYFCISSVELYIMIIYVRLQVASYTEQATNRICSASRRARAHTHTHAHLDWKGIKTTLQDHI